MITAIVLAAGAGSRLGGPKALLELGGRTAVALVAETCARSLADEVVVVTGCEAERVGAGVAEARISGAPVRCVRNARWESGRTGSLQAGWSAAPSGAHVLVFPVDHPAVGLVALDVLLGVFGYAAAAPEVVVPVVTRDGARRRGHPVLLSARLREAALALAPDAPLSGLVHAHEVLEVPVDDEGVLLNVNTPDDLARARALLAARNASRRS